LILATKVSFYWLSIKIILCVDVFHKTIVNFINIV